MSDLMDQPPAERPYLTQEQIADNILDRFPGLDPVVVTRTVARCIEEGYFELYGLNENGLPTYAPRPERPVRVDIFNIHYDR